MSAIIAIYFICALLLTVYGINTHILIHLFKRRYPQRKATDRTFLANFYGGEPPFQFDTATAARLPFVTTQLPVYNELNVVERLIDAVVAFEYPPGRHEIQVLDDSTDQARELVAKKVRELPGQGESGGIGYCAVYRRNHLCGARRYDPVEGRS